MKKYFYSDGSNNHGPFSFEELKDKDITRDTLVWSQNMGDWKKAGMVYELNGLFSPVPPMMQSSSQYSRTDANPTDNSKTIDVLVLIGLGFWLLSSSANFILTTIIEDWYDTPVRYFQVLTNLIFAVLPIIFAFSIKNKDMRIIGIIVGALITIYLFSSNIYWLFQMM